MHDQSTEVKLMSMVSEGMLNPRQAGFLFSDIIGHNDGAKILGTFWPSVAWRGYNYPFPKRVASDYLAGFDRFDQGLLEVGATKIFRTLNTDLQCAVKEAYYTNPANTIRQLEAIALRISLRTKKDFTQTQFYKDAIEAQRRTIRAYERLEMTRNGVRIGNQEATTSEQFLHKGFFGVFSGSL